MRKILFAAVFAIFASTQAFAIVGAGAHYLMNLTGSLKASNGTVYRDTTNNLLSIDVNQEKADGLQGIGFKIWIDFLPFIDIEGTLNVSATRYKTSLIINPAVGESITIPLAYTPDAPYNMIFDRADPLYGKLSGDVSITYPITSLPLIRPYAGLGFSYGASIPIIDAGFTEKMLKNSSAMDVLKNIDPNDPNYTNAAKGAATDVGNALVKTLKDSDYKTNITGHIIAGFRIKPPIIPLAVYTNGKYYFGGDFVIEAGGGLAL